MRTPNWGLLLLAAPAAGLGVLDATSDTAFRRGVESYREGDYETAIDAFETCVRLTPLAGDCLTNLASVLLDADPSRAAESEAMYRRALEADPGHADAAFNLALMLQDKREDGASREALLLYLGVAGGDPRRWDVWANLAAVAANLRDPDDDRLLATRAFQRGIVELERTHEASAEPADEDELGYLASMYYGLGMQLAELSAEQCAAFAAEPNSLLVGVAVGADGVARDTTSGEELGSASSSARTVCAENAQNALRTTLSIEPQHELAAHMLISLGTGAGAEAGSISRASPGFVQALFDDFSADFDTKLASLEYAVPRLLGEAAAAHVAGHRRGAPFASALDAGCGTGLAGPHLRPLVRGTLSGVDLSPRMLERAALLRGDGVRGEAGLPVYDVLLDRDLLALTAAELLPPPRGARAAAAPADEGVGLVAAADVLVYFGELHALLAAFGELAAPSSALIFSCEKANAADAPAGWRLLPSGRFAHTEEYVVDAAASAGYRLLSVGEIVPRTEFGKPVPGHLFVFVRGQG